MRLEGIVFQTRETSNTKGTGDPPVRIDRCSKVEGLLAEDVRGSAVATPTPHLLKVIQCGLLLWVRKPMPQMGAKTYVPHSQVEVLHELWAPRNGGVATGSGSDSPRHLDRHYSHGAPPLWAILEENGYCS